MAHLICLRQQCGPTDESGSRYEMSVSCLRFHGSCVTVDAIWDRIPHMEEVTWGINPLADHGTRIVCHGRLYFGHRIRAKSTDPHRTNRRALLALPLAMAGGHHLYQWGSAAAFTSSTTAPQAWGSSPDVDRERRMQQPISVKQCETLHG